MSLSKYYSFLIVVSAIILHSCSAEITPKIQESEILWDTWGVPHIYATDESDLYYLMGWAQMHSHGNLLMKLYAEARGEAPKYLGESALELTNKLYTLGIPDLAKSHYDNLYDEEKSVIADFVNGINAYAENHPDHIAENLKGVLPIQETDVYGHSLRDFYVEFIGNRELGKVQNIEMGSNTWAISPERSTSGKAMLVANPHLQYNDLWLFYEAHLNTDDYSLYGSTLIGLPTLGIAFNEHLGWTHTVNTLDAADLYKLKLKEDGYILDGEIKDFKTRSYEIEVLNDDGSNTITELVVKDSEHGPVVRECKNEAVALRLARIDDPGHMTHQWKKMGESRNLEEFQTVLNSNDLPMFNVMYADKEGNIFYHFAGYIPERSEGDWEFWSGEVPGDDSKYIWNSYHSYDDMPKLLNPKTGWLQNANDPPYTSTIPIEIDPKQYPSYMAPLEMEFRPQRSAHIIMEDESISFDELVEYKHDTKMEIADRLMDDLLALEDKALSEIQIEAFEVLKKWDRHAEVDSEGGVLFANWLLNVSGGRPYENHYFEKDWSFDAPDITPDGIKDGQNALASLEKAASELKKNYGKINVKWGDVNKLKIGDKMVSGNGGHGWLGEFRTVYYTPLAKKGTPEALTNYAVAGDTYVAVIEFGERPKAKVLLTYGNATQNGNPHVGDQLDLFSEKKMRDAWFERSDVEANLERRESIRR